MPAPAKLYICNGGSSSRWRGYLGIEDKHDIVIGGETLLSRTFRLIDAIMQYRSVPKVSIYDQESPYGVLSPIFDTLDRKGEALDDIIVIPGDVYFTRRTLNRILLWRDPDAVTMFGKDRGRFKGYPEIYAMRFDVKFLPVIRSRVNFRREKPFGFRTVRRTMESRFVNFVTVDEKTEDFDTPTDYVEWIKLYGKVERDG